MRSGRPCARSAAGAALPALALFTLACAGAPSAGLPEEPEEDAATGLVWIVGADGLHRTLWVSTQDGRPIASQPIDGPVWAAGSALWQWVSEPAPVPLSACADPPAEPPAPGEALATAEAARIVLRELTGSTELEIVPAPRGRPCAGSPTSSRPARRSGRTCS
ncbi:MAG: hypothetical protein M5U28_12310 [Sandaracinaceae bacterium]|nr:hypothetical protein [Sandaracinaceae bacterium]